MKSISYIFGVLICLSTTILSSQEWDVRAGGQYFLNQNFNEVNTFEYTSNVPLFPDAGLGVYESQRVEVSSTYEITYTSTRSISVGGGYSNKLAKHLNYRVGADIYETGYDFRETYINGNTTILSSDTLTGTPSSFNGGTGIVCDVTENSEILFGSIEDLNTVNYRLYDLGLSFELSYSGIAKGLALGIGGDMRTPLFSNVSQLRITTDMREDNGLTICRYELERLEDKTGNNLNNFKLGMHAFVSYELSEDMRVEVGAHQMFSDIYTYDDNTAFGFSRQNSFKPLSLFLRLSYTLNPVLPAAELGEL